MTRFKYIICAALLALLGVNDAHAYIDKIYVWSDAVDPGEGRDLDQIKRFYNIVMDEDGNLAAMNAKYMISAESLGLYYTTTDNAANGISNLIVLAGKKYKDYTSYSYKGRTYYPVGIYGRDKAYDLNSGASGSYIYLFYTKDGNKSEKGNVITSLLVRRHTGKGGTYVGKVNSDGSWTDNVCMDDGAHVLDHCTYITMNFHTHSVPATVSYENGEYHRKYFGCCSTAQVRSEWLEGHHCDHDVKGVARVANCVERALVGYKCDECHGYGEIEEVGDINPDNHRSAPVQLEDGRWQCPDCHAIVEGGTGTVDDPIRINSANDLLSFANRVNGGETSLCARLMKDVDLKDVAWPVMKNYSGVFDGNNHTISNMLINNINVNVSGFVGTLTGSAVVKDLTLEGVNNTPGGDRVGMLAGWLRGGNIMRCHVRGTVIGGLFTGGLVGHAASADGPCSISDCTVKCHVIGTAEESTDHPCAAGVVGALWTSGLKLHNIYANCRVEGKHDRIKSSALWSHSDVTFAPADVSNVFYDFSSMCGGLAGQAMADNQLHGTVIRHTDVTRGKMAVLFNADSIQGKGVWHQTLGVDVIPVTDPSHNTLYADATVYPDCESSSTETGVSDRKSGDLVRYHKVGHQTMTKASPNQRNQSCLHPSGKDLYLCDLCMNSMPNYVLMPDGVSARVDGDAEQVKKHTLEHWAATYDCEDGGRTEAWHCTECDNLFATNDNSTDDNMLALESTYIDPQGIADIELEAKTSLPEVEAFNSIDNPDQWRFKFLKEGSAAIYNFDQSTVKSTEVDFAEFTHTVSSAEIEKMTFEIEGQTSISPASVYFTFYVNGKPYKQYDDHIGLNTRPQHWNEPFSVKNLKAGDVIRIVTSVFKSSFYDKDTVKVVIKPHVLVGGHSLHLCSDQAGADGLYHAECTVCGKVYKYIRHAIADEANIVVTPKDEEGYMAGGVNFYGAFNSPVNFDASRAAYSGVLRNDEQWQSLCVPFAFGLDAVEGSVEICVINDVKTVGNTTYLCVDNAPDYIAAGTPLMIKHSPVVSATAAGAPAEGTPFAINGQWTEVINAVPGLTVGDNWTVNGAFAPVALAAGEGKAQYYGIEGDKMMNVQGETTAEAYRLWVEGASTASNLVIVYGDTPTGVKDIPVEGREIQAIYNAAGQQVNKMQQGVNIILFKDGTSAKVMK